MILITKLLKVFYLKISHAVACIENYTVTSLVRKNVGLTLKTLRSVE